MTGTSRTPAGIEGEAAERRHEAWRQAGGVLALLTALALWVVVIAGVMAPLGDALARLDARRAEAARPACAAPAGALAAASPARGGACR